MDREKILSSGRFFLERAGNSIKNHPVIVGYNPLNEPHPEKFFSNSRTHEAELKTMLFNFYESVIMSIRSVDNNTPIILDSSGHADAKTFTFLKPIACHLG